MKKLLFLLIPALLLASCGQVQPRETPPQKVDTVETPITPKPTETPTTPPPETTIKMYSTTEVAKHNSQSNCWLIIEGRVYDITKYIPNHPGGKSILKGCGKDATAMFSKHPEGAKEMKEKFYIGDVK